MSNIVNRLEVNFYKLGYEKAAVTKEIIIFRKLNNRFDIDLDTEQVRFYKKISSRNTFSLYKTYPYEEFLEISGDWIRNNIK